MDLRVMQAVEAAEGRNAKLALLRGLTNDDLSREFLRYAFDPYITYGVTVDLRDLQRPGDRDSDDFLIEGSDLSPVEEKNITRAEEVQWWRRWASVLDALAERRLTGRAAQAAVSSALTAAPSGEHVKWAARVLQKDLRCGVGATSAIKAFPGLFDVFKVALATPYKHGQHSMAGKGYVEPKFDGERLVVVGGKPLSRAGKYIYGVQHIIAELWALAPLEDVVFDGEIAGKGTFEQTTSGRHDDSCHRPVAYHVWDVVDRKEWVRKKTVTLATRKRNLLRMFHAAGDQALKHVKLVPHRLVTNPSYEALKGWRDQYLENGYDGIKCDGAVWKAAGAPYSFRRDTTLLKIKRTDETSATIVDSFPGTGKYEGMLGGWWVRLDNGLEQKCGSGFTDEQRRVFWEQRESLVGQVVDVEFNERTGHDKLRFPRFYRLRSDL